MDLELAQAVASLDPVARARRIWDPPDLGHVPPPTPDQQAAVDEAGGLDAWEAQRRRELLSDVAWSEHKLLLARHLPYDDWDRIRRAYTGIEQAKRQPLTPEAVGSTLDAVIAARASTLHALDRAHAIILRHITDPAEEEYSGQTAWEEQQAEYSEDGLRILDAEDLVVALRWGVALGRLTPEGAESLAGFLLLRSARGDDLLPDELRGQRKRQMRELGIALRAVAPRMPRLAATFPIVHAVTKRLLPADKARGGDGRGVPERANGGDGPT